MEDKKKTKPQLMHEIKKLREQVQSLQEKTKDYSSLKKSLQETQGTLNAVLNSAQDCIFIKDAEMKYTYVNPALESLFGMPAEKFIGRSVADIMKPKSSQIVIKADQHTLSGEVVNTVNTLKFGDREVTFHVIQVPLRSSNGSVTGLCGIARDITGTAKANQALRESEEKYRMLFNQSSEGLMTLSLNGVVLEVNPRFLEMTGFDRSEILGRGLFHLARLFKVDVKQVMSKYKSFISGKVVRTDWTITKKDGSQIDISVFPSLIKKKKKPFGMFVIITDVTEEKRAEKQMKRSLEEKNALLHEIHHRVKNNLQIINSMINLQKRHIQNAQVREFYEDMKNRILSMALVHDRLYKSKDFARINFREYLRSMTNELKQAYLKGEQIRLILDAEDIYLSIEEAMPIGLIVNELVTNSIKHAFPYDRKGDIRISLKASSQSGMILSVKDDGVGLPEEIDIHRPKALGFQLVRVLLNQLDASMRISARQGTHIEMAFALK